MSLGQTGAIVGTPARSTLMPAARRSSWTTSSILVKDYLLGKGKMKEETALTVDWVGDGIDQWYPCVAVISALPCCVKIFDDKYEAMMG
jgi:hypothetical protein